MCFFVLLDMSAALSNSIIFCLVLHYFYTIFLYLSLFSESSFYTLFDYSKLFIWTSLAVQMVKNLPAMWETQVQSLGQEDPLEKGMATHSSVLAWDNPMDGGALKVTVRRVTKSQTRLSD